jgi:hypothetical protein
MTAIAVACPPLQGIEVGDAIDATDDDLAANRKAALPVLPYRLYYAWVAPCPVVAASGNQADGFALAPKAHASGAQPRGQ